VAGYSQTPLVQKLGIKPGMRLYFAGAPADYPRTLRELPTVIQHKTLKGPLDFIQVFVTRKAQLEQQFGALTGALAPDGMLWVSWPKQAAKVPTDVTEDVVRAFALLNGLVDVKVCAVDDVWSALKLVRRLKDR
jgi:hypothetical protein